MYLYLMRPERFVQDTVLENSVEIDGPRRSAHANPSIFLEHLAVLAPDAS